MEKIRKDIDNVMDDAFKLGVANSGVASAYYLEAIAKMMYVQMFHKEYVRDYDDVVVAPEEKDDEVSESTNI